MTFSDFTSINKVKEYFPDIIISKEQFIPLELSNLMLNSYFEDDIKFSMKTYKPSEAFADKFLIAPLLNFVWQKHEKLNIWTEKFIKADEILQGKPDYLISPLDRKQYEILSLPIVVIVEAKQENFTAGWGQCLAEMIACQKLNKQKNINIYGIVATGQYWEFGKLESDIFIKETNTCNTTNLHLTINTLNYIFEQAENEIPKLDLSVILPDNELTNDKKTSAF